VRISFLALRLTTATFHFLLRSLLFLLFVFACIDALAESLVGASASAATSEAEAEASSKAEAAASGTDAPPPSRAVRGKCAWSKCPGRKERAVDMDTCVDCAQVFHSRCAPEFVDGRCHDCHGDAEHAAAARRAESVFSRQTFSQRPGAVASSAALPLSVLGSSECPLLKASRMAPVPVPFVAPRRARPGKLAFLSMFSQDAPVVSARDIRASAAALAAALKARGVRHYLGAEYHDPYGVWASYDIRLDRERVEELRGLDVLVFRDLMEHARRGDCGALSVCVVRIFPADVCIVESLSFSCKLLSCACVPAGARVLFAFPCFVSLVHKHCLLFTLSLSLSFTLSRFLLVSTVAWPRLRRACARAHFAQHARGRVHGIGRH